MRAVTRTTVPVEDCVRGCHAAAKSLRQARLERRPLGHPRKWRL